MGERVTAMRLLGQNYRKLMILGLLGTAFSGTWAIAPEQHVPIEREWKAELFNRSTLDLLKGYVTGDSLVCGGRFDSGKPARLICFGHQGTLSIPVEMAPAQRGDLLRGRFRVAEKAGHKGLKLLAALGRLDTHLIRQQASNDYRSLLPQITRLCIPADSHLLREQEPASEFQVVPPPEGWQVLYVTLQRSSPKYEAHIALRYELSGTQYRLTRCWAEQRPKTSLHSPI